MADCEVGGEVTPAVPKPTPKPKHAKGVKRVNPERKAREFERTYLSKERVEFVKGLPCIVPHCRRRPSDNAHITPDGMARKGHYTTIVPACRMHHTRLDTHPDGREGFEGEMYVDLEALAADTEKHWLAHSGGSTLTGE